jgi:methionyl aminopeptidase
VIHGIPSASRKIKSGDIVSVDLGATINGYNGDNAATFAVGEISEEAKRLIEATRESLYEGIKAAVAGGRIGDIGHAISSYVEARGFSVVREFVGHGVGTKLHEAPEVPNYGRKGNGLQLRQGMCLAIEPMITLGKRQIFMERDGWTVRTRDRKNAAHFEHTIAVGKNGADILSSFEFVEEVLRSKGY